MLMTLIGLRVVAIHLSAGQDVDRAIKELKTAQASGSQIELHLHGTISIQKPLVLKGFKHLRIIGHDHARISGGVTIPKNAWKRTRFLGNEVYQASFEPGYEVHAAWSGNTRFRRPTLPRTGFWRFAEFVSEPVAGVQTQIKTKMRVLPNTVNANWHNLQRVELVANQLWVTSRLGVKQLTDGLVEFQSEPLHPLQDDEPGKLAPFRAENVAEALNQPGQFYWDPSTRSVYVSAASWRQGPSALTFAKSPSLLHIRSCDDLSAENIEFSHAEWDYPPSIPGDPQAAFSVPGAVEVSHSNDCRFDHCKFTHLGNYAIEIKDKSQRISVTNSSLTDLGGGGVKVDNGTSYSTISNCVISGGGQLHAPAVGILIRDSDHNTVSRNLISDFLYTGISIGWVWGYGPSQGHDNLIERNVIHTIGQRELSDMGGIYNLGVSPGTIIRQNLIANVFSRTYGGWGIYLDEGSTGVLVTKNAVFGTRTGTFHQHYGKDNVVTHNLLCGSEAQGQIIRTRQEPHTSFRFIKNVVMWTGTPLFAGNPDGGGIVSENNRLDRSDAPAVLPSFDTTSTKLSAKDPALVQQWFGEFPGSRSWWQQFGPIGVRWQDEVKPMIQPWIDRLKSKLHD